MRLLSEEQIIFGLELLSGWSSLLLQPRYNLGFSTTSIILTGTSISEQLQGGEAFHLKLKDIRL